MIDSSQSILKSRQYVLPLFVTEKNKIYIGLMMYLFAGAIYLTTNHFPIFPPQLLPMTWLDQRIPFFPNSVWIYVSEYLLFAISYLAVRRAETLNKFIYSFLAIQGVSCFIFWVWPTTYPRSLFPLPNDLNALTYHLFSQLRVTDSPANCAPSLHVSSSYLCSFLFLDEQQEKFPLYFLWATAIAVATLTTKQHYIIDVVMGFSLAAVAYWFFHRVCIYRQLGNQPNR